MGNVAADAAPMYAIALPAILTNVAVPVANGVFAGIISRFGDQAIAANAIIDRLVPVAFGGLFALSGAVGPILGQNWGAGRFDRMRQGLKDSCLFMSLYVCAVWLVLLLGREGIVIIFQAQGLTAELVRFFCTISGAMWFFVGLLFVANAAFNNLGFPLLSTAVNWARATVGIIPFAFIGANLGGAKGALLGLASGSVPFGVAAIVTAFRVLRILERRASASRPQRVVATEPARR
jgi:Na+-driven multidrug efflux pump